MSTHSIFFPYNHGTTKELGSPHEVVLCDITTGNDLTNEIEDSRQNSPSLVNAPPDFESDLDDEDDFYSPDEGDFADIFDREEETGEETDFKN